jgi:hypothetical protein
MRIILRTCLAMLAAIHATTALASYVYTPLARQVEEADLIVIGRVIRETPNQYKAPGNNCGRSEAVLAVLEVLRGKFESPRAETMADGNRVQTIRVRHYDTLDAGSGNFHQIVMDPRYKDRIDGIWILRRSDIPGVYCTSYPFAERLDQLASIQNCIRALDANYSTSKPGFQPDEQTWISTYNAHADVGVLADGGLFVEGAFRNELYITDRHALSSPEHDHFLARLRPDGSLEWVRALGSGQQFEAKPYAGLDNTCLLMGELNAPSVVLGETMPWKGGRSQLIVSVSREGNVKWSQLIEGGVYENGGSIILTEARTYCVVGSFTGELVCGGRHVNAVPGSGSDWFVATLGEDGRVIDLKRVVRGSDEWVTRAAMGTGGEVILGGSVTVPGNQLDGFVAAVSRDGRALWTITEGGPFDDRPMDLAAAPDGFVVATMQVTTDRGYPSQKLVMCAWNPKGRRLWRVDGGGSDVELGSDGKIYCLGTHGQNLMVPQKDMPATAGDADLYLACYNRRGERLWVARDGGMSGEIAGSLHLLPNHRAIVSGFMQGTSFLAGKVIRPRGWMDSFVMNIPLPSQKN